LIWTLLSAADFAPGPHDAARNYSPHRIDLVTSIDGVTFEEAWASRVAGNYGGVDVWYIGRDALIRNKAAAARPQDLADIATLR
jgi:nitrous oxide reductase